jgi:nucleolar complex protein 3
LAKFAHLVNFDTVVDLLKVLRELLKSVRVLPLDAALNCVMAAFQTLRGPGRDLQIDQKEYVNPLYSQLPRLIVDEYEHSLKYKHATISKYNTRNTDYMHDDGNKTTSNTSNIDLTLKCLNAAFIQRKEYSATRVAAFIKQLCTVSLHATHQPHISVPLLAFARQLLHRYPSTSQLLENEQDVIASGTYVPDIRSGDAEHSNPFATSAWELATLRFSVFAPVVKQAEGLAAGKMLALPMEDPGKLMEELADDRQREGYISHRVWFKKHPLLNNHHDGPISKRNRRRNRKLN